MSTIDRDMLKQYLYESTLKEIQEIENIDYSFIKASEQFKERIKNDFIMAKREERKYPPKKIAFILVATLTICFLILFSVSAQIRTAVIDFFLEVYKTFTVFVVENEDDVKFPTIETEYLPKYFEENGYQKGKFLRTELNNSSVWSKDKINMFFSQLVIKENDIVLDSENAEYEIKFVGEQKVYYKFKNNTNSMKWLAYGYSFSLTCPESLGWEEIEKIIMSVEPIETK